MPIPSVTRIWLAARSAPAHRSFDRLRDAVRVDSDARDRVGLATRRHRNSRSRPAGAPRSARLRKRAAGGAGGAPRDPRLVDRGARACAASSGWPTSRTATRRPVSVQDAATARSLASASGPRRCASSIATTVAPPRLAVSTAIGPSPRAFAPHAIVDPHPAQQTRRAFRPDPQDRRAGRICPPDASRSRVTRRSTIVFPVPGSPVSRIRSRCARMAVRSTTRTECSSDRSSRRSQSDRRPPRTGARRSSSGTAHIVATPE